jgi:hypothetical protein
MTVEYAVKWEKAGVTVTLHLGPAPRRAPGQEPAIAKAGPPAADEKPDAASLGDDFTHDNAGDAGEGAGPEGKTHPVGKQPGPGGGVGRAEGPEAVVILGPIIVIRDSDAGKGGGPEPKTHPPG